MALNPSGQISISDICGEKRIPTANSSLTTLSTTNINTASIAKPNGVAPHSLTEFYSYNHFATSIDTTPPNDPILSSSLGGSNSIILSWTIPYDNVRITGYEIYSSGNLFDWYLVYSTNSGSVTSYTIDGLSSGKRYYKIRARDAAGNWSVYSNTTSQTISTGGNCFVEGTLITLPDGSKKAIEELHLYQLLASAEIKTLNDSNQVNELYQWSSDYLSETRITTPITQITKEVAYKTIIINGGLLETTPTHSQLIQRDRIWRFIPIGEIIVGDNLYGINKEIIPVTSVSVNLEKRNIYPMSLSPSHTYFANGILTHNVKPTDPV
ncbi:fibronectin type III domain-containing protein [Flavobacterium sp.]|uniref:fibronectin type III domain-containing protein n=1 Tax=Flavobacterium sp. TaxID=239 RepID=UPI003D116794